MKSIRLIPDNSPSKKTIETPTINNQKSWPWRAAIWNDMAAQLKTTHHRNALDFSPEFLESEPLQLNELLKLIMIADEFGYSVKSAHDPKSGDNSVLAEIFSVWYAIEHELLIFAHNVPWLTSFARLKSSDYSVSGH